MADVFRQPLVAPPSRKKAADQSFRAPNLLLTTLAVVAAAPFFGRTMDNPVVRKPAAQQSVNLGRSALILPQLMPVGRQQDFPNPVVAKRAAQPPMPQGNLLVTTLVPAVAGFPVGRQQDFPNPVVRKHLLRVNIHRSSYDPPAPEVPPEPFPIGRQQDFPNPVTYRRTLAGMEFEHNHYVDRPDYLLTSLRHDWPNPTLRKYVQQPQPLPNLLLSTLYVVPIKPFEQSEWPNPTLRKYAQQPQPLPNLLTTLYAPAPPFPVGRMQDFPNPVRAKYTQVRYEISGTPLPNTIPDPIVPPTPEPSGYIGGGGGGGGGPWYKESRKRPTVYDKLRQDIKEVVIDERIIRDVYAELMASDQAAPEAAKAVQTKRDATGEVDFDALSRDMEAVQQLMAAAKAEQIRREIAEDDAEWEWFA